MPGHNFHFQALNYIVPILYLQGRLFFIDKQRYGWEWLSHCDYKHHFNKESPLWTVSVQYQKQWLKGKITKLGLVDQLYS